MTHVHDSHGHGSTIIERDEGPAYLLVTLIVAAAIALLVWFFAFSGIVIDRGSDTGPTINNEQNNENPPATNMPTTGGTSGY